MSRLQKAFLTLLVCSAALSSSARGEQPTAKAISAYSAECKRTGQAMDLIARFGTDYSGLDLSGIDFRGVHAGGLETNLRGADFSHANLQGTEFGASNLDGADFNGANLEKASFVTASLRKSSFIGARLDETSFQESDLTSARLLRVDLSHANISGSTFSYADLSGATLSGVKNEYWGSDFSYADLSGADLRDMRLNRANFKNANLRSAKLSGCQLEQADFTDANLDGADFHNARVQAAIFARVRGLGDKELERLTAEARRWEFDLEKGVTAFVDSPVFAVCLLVAIPLATIAVHTLRRRKVAADSAPKSRFQISLASLLTIVLGVALFLGIGRWSYFGAYNFAMVCALTMMVAEAFYGRASTRWCISLWLFAAGYVGLNFCLLCGAANEDIAFKYLPALAFAVIILGPLFAIFVAVASISRRPAARAGTPWTALAGFTLWMIGVAVANAYILMQALAGV